MYKRATAAGALLVLCLLALPVYAQARSVFWQRWDVVIDNIDTAANRFDVAETHDVHFTGSFTFGSRVISRANLTDIQDIQVYSGEQALRRGCAEAPGTFCVSETSDGVSIRYYFTQPLVDTSHIFRITYSVTGALRSYEGGDQLWWTAIPPEHFGFSIGSSTVTVHMPDGFAPRAGVDPVVTYGAAANVSVEGTVVKAATTSTIRGDDRFEIRVQYPHDPAALPATWQETYDEQAAFENDVKPLLDLGAIAISALVGLGGVLGVFGLWYTRGRDPQIGPVPEHLSEPPSDLRPAVAGTLIDERADTRDVLSILLDLANRGYLVIEESQSDDFFGIWKSRTFTFKRTDKGYDDLLAFERSIMKKVFPSGQQESTLESLRNRFYTVIPEVQRDLYAELVEAGMFNAPPDRTRTRWSILGIAVAALGIGIAVVAGMLFFEPVTANSQFSPALICLPMALMTVAAALFIASQAMPAKTRAGAEEAAKWTAFREYLRNLDKYGDVHEAADQFARYLPYAVAFDLDRSWVQRFSAVEQVAVPYWYYPTYAGGRYSRGFEAGSPLPPMDHGDLARAGGDFSLDTMSGGLADGLNSISEGLTAMLNSASQVVVSRPASSGSSGSWSGGGSSWSGGGFSGGSSGGGSAGFG